MTRTNTMLESDEQALKNKLDRMYEKVSSALEESLRSLINYDVKIATQVVNQDHFINELQYEIAELSVQTIALRQPVASDLRKLMTDIYISMELERIADHAVAVAKIVRKLDEIPGEQYINSISEMAEKCKSMLVLAKQAYDEGDEQLARNVAAMDDDIDRAEQEIDELMFKEIGSKPEHGKTYAYLLWIIHNLERIGDRATNIAERVVYMETNETPDLNH